MATKNDITGDSIQTRGVTNAYRDNYDLIWGKKKEKSGEDKEQERTQGSEGQSSNSDNTP